MERTGAVARTLRTGNRAATGQLTLKVGSEPWAARNAADVAAFGGDRDTSHVPDPRIGTEMGSQTTTVLYIVLLVATIVAVDLLFFRNQFWERLMVNVGIVLVFSAFYFRFLRRP